MRFFRYAAFAFAAVASAAFAFAAPVHAAPCAPPKLVHIVLTDVTPGIVPGSFNAQPRTYYRLGNAKMRIEEALDQVNGIHGLVVVSEPNIWMINLFDNTGKHITDPGPTFNAIAPVLGVPGLPAKLSSLELGCEADFLAANALTPTGTQQIGNATLTVYRISAGNDAIELLERKDATPAYARYYHDGKLAVVLRYDVYETGLRANPSLFVPPAGIRISETGATL